MNPSAHQPQGRKRYLHAQTGQPLTHKTDKIERIAELQRRKLSDQEKKTLSKLVTGLKRHLKVTPLPAGTIFYFHIDFDNLASDDSMLFVMRCSQRRLSAISWA